MLTELPALWFRPHAEVAAMVREAHGVEQAFAAQRAGAHRRSSSRRTWAASR